MTLDSLPLNQQARISAIDWHALDATESHRLRSLGFESGATVEALHRGMLFWRDPLSVRIGRMTVAIRSRVAAAIRCETNS